MQAFFVHIPKDKIDEFQLFICPRRAVRHENMALPSGDRLVAIITPMPYTRHEVEKLGYASILPQPYAPGTIGASHASKFPHVNAHAAMTPYELRMALHKHPEHNHPLLHPEW